MSAFLRNDRGLVEVYMVNIILFWECASLTMSDNVGGRILDLMLLRMKPHGRITALVSLQCALLVHFGLIDI